MSLWAIIAVAVFFASVVLSQKLAARAAARLDDATKLRIVEVFPKRNANFTMFVFGMVIVFLVAIYIFPGYFSIIAILYGFSFAAYLFAKLYLNVKKLKEISAPQDYIRNVIVSFGVFIGGAVAAGIVYAVGNSRLLD